MARAQANAATSSDDEMVMEIVNLKENRNPASNTTIGTSKSMKRKPAVAAAVTTKKAAKSKVVAAVAASSEAEDEVEEQEDEDEESSTEADSDANNDDDDDVEEEGIAAPVKKSTSGKKMMSKKEMAASAAAAPVAKTKKSKNAAAAQEDYEIVDAEVKVPAAEKRLQAKLDAMTKAYNESVASFESLRALRYTRPEESEKALTEIAAQQQRNSANTLSKYKQDNEQLLSEISFSSSNSSATAINGDVSHTSTASSHPRSLPSSGRDAERILELEEEKQQLTRDNARLSSDVEVLRERNGEALKGEKALRKEMEIKEHRREVEVERLVVQRVGDVKKASAELEKDLQQVKAELAAEIEHSKLLQQKLKSNSSGINGHAASTASSSTSSSTAAGGMTYDRLREECDSFKARLALNEDLTGLQVTSISEQAAGTVFSCLLSDFMSKNGTLDFKVQFPPDGSFCYMPNLDAERDAEMYGLLPIEYRSFMRFDACESAKWYKRLVYAINKLA